MKIALVTTPPEVRSGIGDYTRHLLPYLREHARVDLFVEPGREVRAGGEHYRSLAELDPLQYDRLMWQLGNEQSHAFMPRAIRELGGVVVQHDWVLFDQSLAAYPALARGGLKGLALAFREGGAEQCARYLRNWMDRRRERRAPPPPVDAEGLPGQLLAGWHGMEPAGRWIADVAWLRLPVEGARRVAVSLSSSPGRTVRLLQDGRELARFECRMDPRWTRLEAEVQGLGQALLAIETTPVSVTEEQRRHGDIRRLASFVEGVEYEDAEGWHDLDLSAPPTVPVRTVDLSRDRFDLPFNGSIVRHAEAFITHSEYVAERIRRVRGQDVPIGTLWHGAERRWHDQPRADVRRELGLDESWARAFLVVSFGGVQPHKRIDRLMQAVALARREEPSIRLVLAGPVAADAFDARQYARALDLEGAVHFTGFLPEEVAWRWLHAGDLSANLRGPTSGGTSGGIFQAFSLGRAVIASDAAEQVELPDSCVQKVPLGEGEVETIARSLVQLARAPERVAALEAATRAFVEEHCHWSLVAARYTALLGEFPRHRSARAAARRAAAEAPVPSPAR